MVVLLCLEISFKYYKLDVILLSSFSRCPSSVAAAAIYMRLQFTIQCGCNLHGLQGIRGKQITKRFAAFSCLSGLEFQADSTMECLNERQRYISRFILQKFFVFFLQKSAISLEYMRLPFVDPANSCIRELLNSLQATSKLPNSRTSLILSEFVCGNVDTLNFVPVFVFTVFPSFQFRVQ